MPSLRVWGNKSWIICIILSKLNRIYLLKKFELCIYLMVFILLNYSVKTQRKQVFSEHNGIDRGKNKINTYLRLVFINLF